MLLLQFQRQTRLIYLYTLKLVFNYLYEYNKVQENMLSLFQADV
jgi:hypothetical protein